MNDQRAIKGYIKMVLRLPHVQWRKVFWDGEILSDASDGVRCELLLSGDLQLRRQDDAEPNNKIREREKNIFLSFNVHTIFAFFQITRR